MTWPIAVAAFALAAIFLIYRGGRYDQDPFHTKRIELSGLLLFAAMSVLWFWFKK